MLASRAENAAKRAYLAAGLVIVAGCFVMTGIAILIQWQFFDVAYVKVALVAGVGSSLFIGVPIARRVVRTMIGARRSSWIDEIARTEGLNQQELQSYFTMDSW